MLSEKKIKRYRKIFYKLLKLKNRLAHFDSFERYGLGIIAMLTFLYSSVYPFIEKELLSNDTEEMKLIKTIFYSINIVSSIYNIFILFLIALLVYYRKRQDPYQIFLKTFKDNKHEIFDKIVKRQLSSNSYDVRDLNISEDDDIDLDTLTDLGADAWTETHIKRSERRRMYKRWYSISCKSFSFLIDKKTKSVIGYICILPMKSSANSHYNTIKSQFMLGEDDLVSEKTFHIYIQAIYILEEHRDKIEALLLLINSMFEKFVLFGPSKSDDFKDLMLYCEGFTNDGIKLIKNFGFKHSKKYSCDGYPIYEFRLTPGGKYSYSSEEYKSYNLTRKTIIELKKFIDSV